MRVLLFNCLILLPSNTTINSPTAYNRFNSTIHLAAFLLPVAAYNSRVDRLQVRRLAATGHSQYEILHHSPVGFKFLLRASQRPFAAACQPFRLDSAARQEFLDVHACEGINIRVVFRKHKRIRMPSAHLFLQVNTFFDTNEDAVLRFTRGIATDLNCMLFRVGGTFVVTVRVVSAIVGVVASLSALLNQ